MWLYLPLVGGSGFFRGGLGVESILGDGGVSVFEGGSGLLNFNESGLEGGRGLDSPVKESLLGIFVISPSDESMESKYFLI